MEQALRRSEARAQQLARFCAVSTAINEAIVRVHDVQALYEHVCRTAVEQGLARLAWIGTLDAGEDCIRVVAQFGAGEGYVDRITLHLRNPMTNRGPAGRAIRSGAYAVTNDIAADSGFYFKQEASALGLRSCAVFPLKLRGQTEGVFAIYTDQIGSFGAEELAVLGALADDISFAVELADAKGSGSTRPRRCARARSGCAPSSNTRRTWRFSGTTNTLAFCSPTAPRSGCLGGPT